MEPALAAGRDRRVIALNMHLELSGLSRRFGQNPPAVDGLTLSLPRGALLALLGPER